MRPVRPENGPPIVLSPRMAGRCADVPSGVTTRPYPAGFRTIVPWLRGFGPTRFLSVVDPALRTDRGDGAGHAGICRRPRPRSVRIVGHDWGARSPTSGVDRPHRVERMVTRLCRLGSGTVEDAGAVAGAELLVPVVHGHRARCRRRAPRWDCVCAVSVDDVERARVV